MVTAAHCLYKDGELVAAKSLSILLGLHDRSKRTEPKRCPKIMFPVKQVFDQITSLAPTPMIGALSIRPLLSQQLNYYFDLRNLYKLTGPKVTEPKTLRGYSLSSSPNPQPICFWAFMVVGEPRLSLVSHLVQFCDVVSFPRQEIQVDDIFIHENYTVVTGSKANDIALLSLGKKYFQF